MFTKLKFSRRQIKNYFASASRDMKIAWASAVPEVIFKFSYDSLIKLAIAVCAGNGLRVKSRAGHHAGLLRKLSEFLNDQDIEVVGNKMRRQRNLDLYGGGILISKKEASEYREWLKNIFIKVEDNLNKNSKLF